MPRAFRSKDRYPKCFIIGARKAGTTALQAFLERHPQIWTRYWEDGFFSREDFYTRGLNRWLHPLPANGSQVNLVKVAEYFHLARVPPRMFAVNNATRFLLIVTDPVRRTISDYLFMRRYTKQPNLAEHSHSFEEMLFKPGTKEIDSSWPCLTRSMYNRHFAVWLKWFPRAQFMVIDGDAFIGDNPARQLQQVETFLNIQPYFKSNDFFYNETKGFYCHRQFGCLGSGKGHTDFTLEPTVEETLREFFKPFNRNFYNLVGRNFNW
ncbi:hypothetical protein CAPTEDRAFT_131040 [Capitella teleta]|uniref:Sulfotransferase domain-containing protein n=1 Tax=Capitella teleta TaxID=283909 RepID=R7VJ30_CAPTE|nr:hypothetical protein CAPTEDRAFT_131040 [Capitella teleta]|eukprot:ELU18644.1 hypothetical protein CAPTEDRAFT_131040 [Capitella teleta]